jgi:hypothetical protein
MWILAFPSEKRMANSIQRQQLSFNGWRRLSLTAKLQPWWFLSPNPTQTLNEMPLAISWRSKCIYSSLCCVRCRILSRCYIMIAVKTRFLVGLLMTLCHLQGVLNAQWTWERKWSSLFQSTILASVKKNKENYSEPVMWSYTWFEVFRPMEIHTVVFRFMPPCSLV